MDLLTLVFATGALLAGFLAKLLISEFQDWLPTIAYRLIDLAVARLPPLERERYREEWYAHNDEWPGRLGKVWHAGECFFASARLAVLLASRASAQNDASKPKKMDTVLTQQPTRASIGFWILIPLGLSVSSFFSTWLGLSHFAPHWSIALLSSLVILICVFCAAWIVTMERAQHPREGAGGNVSPLKFSVSPLVLMICFAMTVFFSFVFLMDALYQPGNAASDFDQMVSSLWRGDRLAWLALMIACTPDFLLFLSFLLGARTSTRPYRQ